MTDITEQNTNWLNQEAVVATEWNVNSVTPSIRITVQATDWTELGTFEAKKWETIMALAQANNVEIPFSCGAGACWLCLCYIIRWWEYINKAYTNPSFMELDEDQVLTCIAAVKDECFNDENANIEIVLKRAI